MYFYKQLMVSYIDAKVSPIKRVHSNVDFFVFVLEIILIRHISLYFIVYY